MEYSRADLRERVVDAVSDHDALIRGDTRLTFAETDARVDRLEDTPGWTWQAGE